MAARRPSLEREGQQHREAGGGRQAVGLGEGALPAFAVPVLLQASPFTSLSLSFLVWQIGWEDTM